MTDCTSMAQQYSGMRSSDMPGARVGCAAAPLLSRLAAGTRTQSRCSACGWSDAWSRKGTPAGPVCAARPARAGCGSARIPARGRDAERPPPAVSFQALQIIDQRLHVLRRQVDGGHVVPWFYSLRVQDPATEVTGNVPQRARRDRDAAAEVREIGRDLTGGGRARDRVAQHAAVREKHLLAARQVLVRG